MEFKSLKNIETSFRQIRFFGIVFVCLCAAVTGFSLWKAYGFAEAQRQKIYVLDSGKSLMLALSQDMSQNRPVEAREHVKRFHELFFTLSPDKQAIESNIKRALFLSDKSAFNYYKDLTEKGYYNRIVSGEHQPDRPRGQREMQLRPLSLRRCNLRQADDCPRKQHHGKKPCYALQINQFGAERQ